MKQIILFTLLALTLMTACKTQKLGTSSNNELEQLQSWMSGSFDSSEQAQQDSSYYNISLQMYPIWKTRKGYWLYVEQAVSSTPDSPYRQRVYELEKVGKNTFASKVYTLNTPEYFVGKWSEPQFFDDFDQSILKEREGCTVFLQKEKGIYTGSTNAKDCASTLRGASYATSKVSVKTDRIESWDQGFNAANEQVWGATMAGYIFKKKQ